MAVFLPSPPGFCGGKPCRVKGAPHRISQAYVCLPVGVATLSLAGRLAGFHRANPSTPLDAIRRPTYQVGWSDDVAGTRGASESCRVSPSRAFGGSAR